MLGFSTAAAASVVAAVIFVSGSCAPTPVTPNPPAASGPATAPATGTTAPATTPPTTASTPPGGPTSVPVYYLGPSKDGPKLYREYHVLTVPGPATSAKLLAAITEMLDGRTAYDPDYSSGWPASAKVLGVGITGTVATVDLGGATVNGYDPVGNRAALQQLIWTATAFPGATGVRLLFDGKQRATLWKAALPVSGVLHRGPASDVLAHVWVIDPQQGVTTGSPVAVKISGVVFEGAVNLQVLDSSGKVVVDKHVQLSVGAPAVGDATTTVTLPPGTYTIAARELSLKDGSVVSLDNHVFTVH